MRRRLTAVFAAGIAGVFGLALSAMLALWPQLRRTEALSSRYAANSALIAQMVGAVITMRYAATQQYVRLRAAPEAERSGPSPPGELVAARRTLATLAAEYEQTPMNAEETEVWGALSREVFPAFLAALDRAIAAPSPGASQDRTALDDLLRIANRAMAMLQRLAELNAAGLDATGRRMHSAVSRLVVVSLALATLGTLSGLVLMRWTLGAVRAYERSTTERIEELDQFAGRVAHDLRNPLHAIGMALSVLHQRAPDEQTQRIVERAQGGARRMGAFIDELLQFARSGAVPDPDASAHVEGVLRSVAQDLAPGVDERRIALTVAAPVDLEAAISPAALRAVVGNLADNAVKHMPEEGDDRRVELRAERVAREVRITVRDTGSGIAPEALPRLFEPFFRGTARPGGFGIGLKTVKRLVDAHGGRISVESHAGRGSVFTVILPASPGPARSPSAGDSATA